MSQGLKQWNEIAQQFVSIDGDRVAHETFATQSVQDSVGISVDGATRKYADRTWKPARESVNSAEVKNGETPVIEQPEVSRVWVGMKKVRACRAGEEKPSKQQSRTVAFRLRT